MSLTAYVQSLLRGIRAGKFLSVGIGGAVLDTLVLTLVVELTQVPPVYAKIVSAEAAIIAMFLVNDNWTFASEDVGSSTWATLRRFARSNVVRAGGVAVALVVLYVLYDVFGVWYPVANVVGIGMGFVVNYVAESLYTWRVHVE